jgi:hypothetical protein
LLGVVRLVVELVYLTHLEELEVGVMDKLLALVVETQVHKVALAAAVAAVVEQEFFLGQLL